LIVRGSKPNGTPLTRGIFDPMSTGRVAHYDEGRGFGFIIPDDGGADVFVHANYLVNADWLRKDQRVSFEVVNDDRRGKPRADKVRVI
jgi:CspA family cold shock protein